MPVCIVRMLLGMLCGAQMPTSIPASGPTGPSAMMPASRSTADRQAPIDRGLSYLAGQQQADGSFTGEHGANVGVVALGTLAFMSAGHLPGRGDYGGQVERGLRFVRGRQQPDGLLVNPHNTSEGAMYEHAAGLLLLIEAWGMWDEPGLRDAIERGVRATLALQNVDGSWRYEPRRAPGDISATVMQVSALRAAARAGIAVPADAVRQAAEYARRCATPAGFLEQPGQGEPAYTRTAAAVCVLLLADQREDPLTSSGLGLLDRQWGRDRVGEAHFHFGAWYAAQALASAGGPRRADWFERSAALWAGLQRADGSWDGEMGPVYGTAMAVLCLTVERGYLPGL